MTHAPPWSRSRKKVLIYPHGHVGYEVFRPDSGCEYGKMIVISSILEAIFMVLVLNYSTSGPVYGPF